MGVSRGFNQLFKRYQGEQAVSAGAGPDGLSCEPCWLPQPPQCSCRSILVLYRTHCLWGEQKAAGDNILYSLFTGGGEWGPNREPTMEI